MACFLCLANGIWFLVFASGFCLVLMFTCSVLQVGSASCVTEVEESALKKDLCICYLELDAKQSMEELRAEFVSEVSPLRVLTMRLNGRGIKVEKGYMTRWI